MCKSCLPSPELPLTRAAHMRPRASPCFAAAQLYGRLIAQAQPQPARQHQLAVLYLTQKYKRLCSVCVHSTPVNGAEREAEAVQRSDCAPKVEACAAQWQLVGGIGTLPSCIIPQAMGPYKSQAPHDTGRPAVRCICGGSLKPELQMTHKQGALVIVKPTAARPTTRNHASVGDSSPAVRIERISGGCCDWCFAPRLLRQVH